MSRIGRVKTTPIQNLRVILLSSELSSSASIENTRGSRAIPQIGQLPGPIFEICGCIGHVYSTSFAFAGVRFEMPIGIA